jgi:hypothetical protein
VDSKMNKTLNQKIVEQVGTDVSGKWISASNASMLINLTVKECINKIESKRSSGENTDQWTITRDRCYRDMTTELKEHFGVEQ